MMSISMVGRCNGCSLVNCKLLEGKGDGIHLIRFFGSKFDKSCVNITIKYQYQWMGRVD